MRKGGDANGLLPKGQGTPHDDMLDSEKNIRVPRDTTPIVVVQAMLLATPLFNCVDGRGRLGNISQAPAQHLVHALSSHVSLDASRSILLKKTRK